MNKVESSVDFLKKYLDSKEFNVIDRALNILLASIQIKCQSEQLNNPRYHFNVTEFTDKSGAERICIKITARHKTPEELESESWYNAI